MARTQLSFFGCGGQPRADWGDLHVDCKDALGSFILGFPSLKRTI